MTNKILRITTQIVQVQLPESGVVPAFGTSVGEDGMEMGYQDRERPPEVIVDAYVSESPTDVDSVYDAFPHLLILRQPEDNQLYDMLVKRMGRPAVLRLAKKIIQQEEARRAVENANTLSSAPPPEERATWVAVIWSDHDGKKQRTYIEDKEAIDKYGMMGAELDVSAFGETRTEEEATTLGWLFLKSDQGPEDYPVLPEGTEITSQPLTAFADDEVVEEAEPYPVYPDNGGWYFNILHGTRKGPYSTMQYAEEERQHWSRVFGEGTVDGAQ